MVALWHQVRNLPADGDASNLQLMAAAGVRLKQHANGEGVARQLDQARGRTNPTLEIELLRAGAGADAAFGDRAVLGRVERSIDILPRDPEGAVVAQEAVIRLGHDRDDDIFVGDLRI